MNLVEIMFQHNSKFKKLLKSLDFIARMISNTVVNELNLSRELI